MWRLEYIYPRSQALANLRMLTRLISVLTQLISEQSITSSLEVGTFCETHKQARAMEGIKRALPRCTSGHLAEFIAVGACLFRKTLE